MDIQSKFNLNGYVIINAETGIQFGRIGDTTSVTKRRFTNESGLGKFDKQNDYVLRRPINPLALEQLLSDMENTNISGRDLIDLIRSMM